jgi:subtilisin family serine protease
LPLDKVTRDWAWGGSNGRGVKVAVIDSGIDATHPAVGGGVTRYVAITEGPTGLVYDTEPHTDAYGHGTACASIIRTLAPDCELYSVKVLGPTLGGLGSIFAAGLRWAVENGAQVCNLSLGTTKRDYFGVLHELADQAYFRNVALVAAANNRSIPAFPSLFASVISVASHEDDNPYRFYCNPRPPVEFGAPGINVRVAWLNGGYLTGTGNSYAAPHITGLVAKILGKHPTLTIPELKTVLRVTADNTSRERKDPHSEAEDPELQTSVLILE